MSTLIDTNTLIYLLDVNSPQYQSCLQKFEEAQANGQVIISDVVYSEFSMGMPDKPSTDQAIATLSVSRLAYSDDVLFRAGRAFLQYKANGGQRTNVLPDFFIGAQAETTGIPLITSDSTRMKTYFPAAKIIEP